MKIGPAPEARESTADEVIRLRACLKDLVSITALPALWTGAEPPQILSTFLDTLMGMLRLSFAFVRLTDPAGGPPIETLRIAEPLERTVRARDVREALDSSLGSTALGWPPTARLFIGDVELSIASARLGLQGEIGVVFAGSRESDFPAQTERLLLEVAANQAALGLQQAQFLYPRRILESFPGLVTTINRVGEIDYLNQEVLDFFGKTTAELKHWAESDAIHPDDLPRVMSEFMEAITAGNPYTSVAHRCRRSDGVYRWFQVRALPMRDTEARITGWLILLTDIDDLKRAEDALRASERSLKLLIDTIPTLAWSSRTDGSVEFFNQHYLDYVGLPAEEAMDWGWRTAFHPDDLERIADGWKRIRASGKSGEHEGRLRRHDGEYRWFLFRLNPFHDEAGNIVKWYGTSTDIDDRKRAEEELRRNEAVLAEAQRLSSTGSFSWRLDTDVVTLSEELYRILEFERGTLVTPEQVATRVHPEDLQLLARKIDAARNSGGDDDHEIRLLMPDGSVKYMRAISRDVRDLTGRREYIGAVQDVTQRHTSEEALSRARSELAHVASAMSLGVLTASIAHEINQPLAGIVTNASTCLRMLASDPPDVDGARETARRTIRDGNRASDVIVRLRALFSRKEPATDPVDLNDATREVIALSSKDLQRNRVILQSDLAADLPFVIGDRIQLQQVILNLLRNASDAMADVEDRPRQLLIRTEREDGDRVRVTVRDSGVGIERESMNALFDAFYTTKSGGMGIGLSVSRSIVERHHGRLWADANDGAGTTFSFSIPRGPESMTGAPPEMRKS